MSFLSAETFAAIRQTNPYPLVGISRVEARENLSQSADEFVKFLSEIIEKNFRDKEEKKEERPEIAGSDVTWTRHRLQLYPLYIEILKFIEGDTGGEILHPTGPGIFEISAAVLDPQSLMYYKNNKEAWQYAVNALIENGDHTGGLCYNTLELTKESLASGDTDIRPVVLHALAPNGAATDRGDIASQAAIANAFWQTFWATGAKRAERGSVFPIAFYPVDRTAKMEYEPPFRERYVSLRRRYFGRSAIMAFVLEFLTKHKGLVFSAKENRFCVADGFETVNHKEDEMPSGADILLVIDELNRTGFVDAYIGANKEAFPNWTAFQEQEIIGAPSPYSPDIALKIKSGVHGEGDYLQRVRPTAQDDSLVKIHRVIPFSGCAFLYQVMTELDLLRERGKIQDFDGELIGATNSTFFLNFPEEYSALHSAMNEPVSLLVENGRTVQLKTMRRAAFVLAEDGSAMVTTRAGNQLESDVLVFEGESASGTYFDKSDKSFADNQFHRLFFGSVVVGDSIVETFEEATTEIPAGGWIIGDSEAFGGTIEPVSVVKAQVRPDNGGLEPMNVRHAFAVGPLLIKDNAIVPLGESKEEFRSVILNESPSFEENKELPRTGLAKALLECPQRGVPPTRFPYDWNVTRAPRSAIGVREDGSIVLAVVDGRADLAHSVGATLAELAEIMKGLGCKDAMNMDGGGSSVMFVNDEEAVKGKLKDSLRNGVVNLPSDLGGVERLLPVPLVVYRKKK